MSTIRLHQTTTSTPEQFVTGLTDFGPGRSKLFGHSADEYLKVHSQGPSQADVTEGSGGIWERLKYDWSNPNRVLLTTTDSNLWGGASGHTYTFTRLFRYVVTILVAILLSAPLVAGITPFPATFHTQMVPSNGTSLYVRVGGKGPAVVLLHGFGDTGDMWAPLAIVLAKDHTVIVPDLRGMGMSDHPDTGYTKKNEAVDIAGVMDALKVQKADLVTHDIGNMVGYALAAQYPVRVTRWVVIDAPLPGIGDWDNITRSPMLWHFNFRGPDEERLVQGRERIYLDRFWNELSGDPKGIDEDTRQHYAALYARPHAMHDAFEQFGAFSQDAADNKALLAKGGKITMPVFAIGAEKFFGKGMAEEMRFAASNVTGGIVPNSGHWIMEENPQATIKLVTDFLAK